MNNHAVPPLVVKKLGGKSAGGVTGTEAGEKAIETFYELENQIKSFVVDKSKKIGF